MSIINVPYKENIFLGEGLKFDEGGPEKQVIYLVWPYGHCPNLHCLNGVLHYQ